MELDQNLLTMIHKIVEDFQKPFGKSSILWYRLGSFRKFEHQSDMNKLAGTREPHIDALCLIIPNDYIHDGTALVVVYENSILADAKYYPDGWQDEVSMTKLKNTKYIWLYKEDREQTGTIIDCGEKYKFHLWKSPRKIGAVTDRCKYFGDIWKNGSCIHRGNRYGDHEHFYVIGSIHWKWR